MTTESVAEKFNISYPSVLKILAEYRVPRYSRAKLYSPDLDEHYFDLIDTEEKAYFLGLLVTDGYIHRTKGRQPMVSICLQQQDEYMLDAFKDEIRSNKKTTSDGRGCCEIQILSGGLVDGLLKYGLHPRKSLDCWFPDNIPHNLYPHFIRGLFDGNGSASFYARPGRKSHVKAVRFCSGTKQFMVDLVDFLDSECGIPKVSICCGKDNLWSIRYASNQSILELINYMYGDAHLYLSRKKHICDLICEEIYKYGNTEITGCAKYIQHRNA